MSHLFYLSTAARPVLDRAEGIYMWDRTGRRFIDGSSGAMVSNIGHSNPAVLSAIACISRPSRASGWRPRWPV